MPGVEGQVVEGEAKGLTVLVEFAVAVAVGPAGLGEEGLGRLRIVFRRVLGDPFPIAPDRGREEPVGRLTEAFERGLDDLARVDRVVERLAHLDVVEWRLGDVELEEGHTVVEVLEHRVFAAVAEALNLRGGNGDLVEFSRFEGRDQGRFLDDRAPDDRLDVGGAVLVEEGGGPGVVRIALHRDVVAGEPLLDHIGTGRDRLAAEVLTGGGNGVGADDADQTAVGEVVEQRRERLAEGEAEGVLGVGGGAGHRTEQRARRGRGRRRVEDAVEAELGGGGVELRPILERDVVAQLEGPVETVLGDRPGLGEGGDVVALVVFGDQAVADVAEDDVGAGRTGFVRVEGVGFLGDPDRPGAAILRRVGGRIADRGGADTGRVGDQTEHEQQREQRNGVALATGQSEHGTSLRANAIPGPRTL